MVKAKYILGIAIIAALQTGCATKIEGLVRLTDMNMNPLTNVSPEGIVVNMINTSVPIEEGSHSVKTDAAGKFVSAEGKVKAGVYKVEATKFGFITDTQTVNHDGSGSREVTLTLKKLLESKRRAIRTENSDADKIINPGEVNIEPPSM